MLIRWACAVGVMLVGGLFGYVAFSVKVSNLRSVKALAQRACPGCARAFGMEDAERARLESHAATQQRLAEARSRGVILRLDGRWRFACPGCGKALVFDPRERTLTLA